MKDAFGIIKDIRRKVELTVSERDKLARNIVRLNQEREVLLAERSKHQSQIVELKRELKALKLTIGMTNPESKLEAKRGLESILREIDVCIDLVNKK